MMEYVVTGISTDVGKTVVSALLCEALQADYWKPVQSGAKEGTDSAAIRALTAETTRIFDEVYCLQEPLSPHAAAMLEHTRIESASLRIPNHDRPLIIEGAGGVHVPLNDRQTFLDVMQVWDIPVIVVSKNYLGSINHTLLTLEVLQQRGIPIAGVVFNGAPTPLSESAISAYSKVPVLGHVPEASSVDRSFITAHAAAWRSELVHNLAQRHPLNLEVERRMRLVT